MITREAAFILLLALCSTAPGAALPDDYITGIPIPDAAPLSSNEETDTDSEAGIPTIFDFPWIRIVDANGDSNPDLLLFGDDIRIVLARVNLSSYAALPCGNADSGRELRDCGEGNGAASPGVCHTGIHATIYSATRSILQVDNLI